MNIKEAWAQGRSLLIYSPTPDLDARLLLEHTLQVNHAFLISHGEDVLRPDQEALYLSFLQRARKQEPIPYITGHAPFYGLDFIVNPDVLIPRPETELLVEAALNWAKPRQVVDIVDVGTGSGCIAVCLAKHLPLSHVHAVDISLLALEIARRNEAQHVPGKIYFYQGYLLNPITCHVDLIIANLPYVTDTEWTMLDDGVKLHEPVIALKGGSDGLDLIRQIFQQAHSKLNPGGAIFLEIGWQQGESTLQMAKHYFPTAQVELKSDHSGHDRIVAVITG